MSDNMYAEDEEDDDFANYDPGLDNERMEDNQRQQYNEIQIENIKNDLLFDIQGVGDLVMVNDQEVYRKTKYSEPSLKGIYQKIRQDSNSDPMVKKCLAEWNFIQKDII